MAGEVEARCERRRMCSDSIAVERERDLSVAGIVTGVGFLGAGMIFRDGDTMRGLTSAAALWAVAAVGMLAGIGEFLIVVLITALILLILEARYLPVLRRLEVQSWRPKDGERGEE